MNYTNKTKYLIASAVFAIAFLTMIALPASTNACGHGGYNECGYEAPHQPTYIQQRPVYVSQPIVQRPIIQQPVYIPQPVIQQPVYVQQQPIYIQQPVIQQPVYVQPQPVYIQQPVIQPVYIAPLTVSCTANNSYNGGYNNYNNSYNNGYNNGYNNYNNGYNNSVTWTAYASGGNGGYSYSWSGTDGLYGNGQSINFNYNNAGSKNAYVTVYSNGQSVTQSCTTYVSGPQIVYQQPIIQQPIIQQPSYNLNIGCYVDPMNARVNQPVTWSVEVTGGMAPYSYTWSGSENLTGSQSSVTKFYDYPGAKNAIVTVTSADGRTGTRACSNSLTVAGATKSYAYKAPVKVVQVPVVQTDNSNQTAASIFSLSNVPWGWVAILIILVLFVTVMYLLLNKQKI